MLQSKDRAGMNAVVCYFDVVKCGVHGLSGLVD